MGSSLSGLGRIGSTKALHEHCGTRSCMCSGRKKSSAEAETLGRSVGGFSCKIHVLTNALGYPLRFILTSGQTADMNLLRC